MNINCALISLLSTLNKHHIRTAQWAVLIGLKEYPNTTANELSKAIRYDHSTVLHMLRTISTRHNLAYCTGKRPLRWNLNNQGKQFIHQILSEIFPKP